MIQSTKTAQDIIDNARIKVNEPDIGFVTDVQVLVWLNEWYSATLEQFRPILVTEEITLAAKTYEYSFTTTDYLLIDSVEYREYDSDDDLLDTRPLIQSSYKDIDFVEADFGPKYFYEREYSSEVKIGVHPYITVASTTNPEKIMVSFVPYSGDLALTDTLPTPQIFDRKAVYYLMGCFYQRDKKDALAERYLKMSGVF